MTSYSSSAKIITDPRNGFAPAGTIVSSLRALQRMGAKTWSGRCLDSSLTVLSLVYLLRITVNFITVSNWNSMLSMLLTVMKWLPKSLFVSIGARGVQNGFFKFGSVWEKPRVRFGFEKPWVRFIFVCRSVVKYKKCLSYVCIWVDSFLYAQLVSNACF